MINVQEQKNSVTHLFEKAGIDLQVVLDRDGRVSREYHVSNHPIKFLIDQRGDMMAMGLGYREWDSEEIYGLVNVLIQNAGETPKI